MRLVTVAGPPSSGKTSIIIRTSADLRQKGFTICVVKFDCLSAQDEEIYSAHNIPVKTCLSRGLCPDHFFVSNIEEALRWAKEKKFDFLITESAGLCNRCSPHTKDVLAICVIDNLSGVNTPKKIGPMLKLAEIVVITKGDIVSQAEREVFAYRVRQVNTRGMIIQINGVTGQSSFYLAKLMEKTSVLEKLQGATLRFTMPGALCSYCLGERKIGDDKQIGVSKLVNFRGEK